HHMAAGLTVPLENIEQVRAKLNEYAITQQVAGEMGEEVQIDKVLEISDLTVDVIEEINQLAPFGTDNPKPTFLLDDVEVQSIRKIGADGTHLKMSVQLDQYLLVSIGFGFGEL